MALEHFVSGSSEGRASSQRVVSADDPEFQGTGLDTTSQTRISAPGRTASPSKAAREALPFSQEGSKAVFQRTNENLKTLQSHASAISGAVKRHGDATRKESVSSEMTNVEKSHASATSNLTAAEAHLTVAQGHFSRRSPDLANDYVNKAAKLIERAHYGLSANHVKDAVQAAPPTNSEQIDHDTRQAAGTSKFRRQGKPETRMNKEGERVARVRLGANSTPKKMGGIYEAEPELLAAAVVNMGKEAPVTKKIRQAIKGTPRVSKVTREKTGVTPISGRSGAIDPSKVASNQETIEGRAGGANMSAYVPGNNAGEKPARSKAKMEKRD